MTSAGPTRSSEGQRVRLVGVDAELADRLRAAGRGQRAAAGQRRPSSPPRCAAGRSRTASAGSRGCRSGRSRPCRAPRNAAAASARPCPGSAFIQSVAATIGPPSCGRIVLTYGTRGRLGVGVEPVPALGLERVAAQQRERRGAVDLGGDPELLGQQVARGEDLLEDRAGADEPGRVRVAARHRAPPRSGRCRAGSPRRSRPPGRTGWA